jgi:hypothetical protein
LELGLGEDSENAILANAHEPGGLQVAFGYRLDGSVFGEEIENSGHENVGLRSDFPMLALGCRGNSEQFLPS